MRVKMTETYQGIGVNALHEATETRTDTLLSGEVYVLDDLTAQERLIVHNKAFEFSGKIEKKKANYGAQAEPELRADDKKAEEGAAEVVGEPIMTTESAKKGGKK